MLRCALDCERHGPEYSAQRRDGDDANAPHAWQAHEALRQTVIKASQIVRRLVRRRYRNSGLKHGIRAETRLHILETYSGEGPWLLGAEEARRRSLRLPALAGLGRSVDRPRCPCSPNEARPLPSPQDSTQRGHGEKCGSSDGSECGEPEHLSVNAHFRQAGELKTAPRELQWI